MEVAHLTEAAQADGLSLFHLDGAQVAREDTEVETADGQVSKVLINSSNKV